MDRRPVTAVTIRPSETHRGNGPHRASRAPRPRRRSHVGAVSCSRDVASDVLVKLDMKAPWGSTSAVRFSPVTLFLCLACSGASTAPPFAPSTDKQCLATQGPADEVLRRYAQTVAATAFTAEPLAPSETWPTVEAAVEEVLWPERALLHDHGLWEVRRLPRELLPEREDWDDFGQEAVRSVSQRLLGGGELDGDPRRVRLGRFFLGWSPVRLFGWLRAGAQQEALDIDQFHRRVVLESVAPPRAFWANDDASRPLIAVSDDNELFAVRFTYDAKLGAFHAESITWLRKPAPPSVKTAEATAERSSRVPDRAAPTADVPQAIVAPEGVCANAPERLEKILAKPECAVPNGAPRPPFPKGVRISLLSSELRGTSGRTVEAMLRFSNLGDESAVLDFSTFCGGFAYGELFDGAGESMLPLTACSGERAHVGLPAGRSSTLRVPLRAIDERTGEALTKGEYRFRVVVDIGVNGERSLEGTLSVD